MKQGKVSAPLKHHQPVTLQGEFSKKLVTNTFFNLVGRSWSFVLALLLTPYILAHLGVRDFGTWVLLSIFVWNGSSFSLLDLGLDPRLREGRDVALDALCQGHLRQQEVILRLGLGLRRGAGGDQGGEGDEGGQEPAHGGNHATDGAC